MLTRRYEPKKEIARLTVEIGKLQGLSNLVNDGAWPQIRSKFQKLMQTFTQDILDLCSNPKKNDVEIRVKKLVVASLSNILISIEGDLSGKESLEAQLEQVNQVRAKRAEKPVII